MPTSSAVEPRSATDLIRAGCTESLAALKKYHGQALKFDAEAIHKIRVGTRRLRAVLRIFSESMDKQWATELEAELRWLAHLLGAVRDLDVLRNRLRSEAKPRDRRAMIYVQRILSRRHREAQAAMREGLKSERYIAIVDRLHAGILSPQVALDAGRPILDLLLPKLAGAWRKLGKKVERIKFGDDPARYHSVRKFGKRIRYAAELLQGDLDHDVKEEAETFVKRMKKLQDVLGELQDSVVAAQTLEQLLELRSTHSPGIRNLIEGQQKMEKRARRTFRSAWDRAANKKHRKWMTA